MISTTTDDSYTDHQNITNGLDYCYKVIAFGDYGLTEVQAPLINQSQESCVVPLDNVPPCPPVIEVSNICDEANPGTPEDAFINYISWQQPCGDDDVASYSIFYSETPGGELTLVGTVSAIQVISTTKYIAKVNIFDNFGNLVHKSVQAFGYQGELGNVARVVPKGLVSYLVWDQKDMDGQLAGQGVYVWKVAFIFENGKQEIQYTRTGIMRNFKY